MELRGSRTAANLMKSFAGESEARNRYTYAASIARKEGYEHIAAIFEETAFNEKEHAKLFFKHLVPLAPGAVEIQASYPVVAGDTTAQLVAAVAGENEEWSKLYPEFARVAREEGFDAIAKTFDWILKVEKEHEKRFGRLLQRMTDHTVFVRDGKIFWRCRNCGHIHEGPKPPSACPVCLHPQAFYEPVGENY